MPGEAATAQIIARNAPGASTPMAVSALE
jgi:hypothetical protein